VPQAIASDAGSTRVWIEIRYDGPPMRPGRMGPGRWRARGL